MSAKILDGKAIAAGLHTQLAQAISEAKSAHQRDISLAVVLVGEDPASQVYVRNKLRACKAVGIGSIEIRLPASADEAEIIAQVARLSADAQIDGILVQLPLPGHVRAAAVLAAIDPAKDVDGLTQISAGRLAQGQPGLRPCTPMGCVILAKQAVDSLAGLNCVILGRSILVGRPAAQLFLAQDCTITLAHSRSQDLPALCRQADILVAAVGRPEMVRGEWIKPGAIVLDVGINRIERDGQAVLVGDVAFDEARQHAGWITPVPGGLGPMTIACLLANTLIAAGARRNWALPDWLAKV